MQVHLHNSNQRIYQLLAQLTPKNEDSCTIEFLKTLYHQLLNDTFLHHVEVILRHPMR